MKQVLIIGKEIVATGSFGDIQENEVYRFYGELVDHPKYGRDS